MTESPRLEPTTLPALPATLPPGVTHAIPRADGEDVAEFAAFERLINIDKRIVRLRPCTNKNIVFTLSFDAIQNLADLTKGDDSWEGVE